MTTGLEQALRNFRLTAEEEEVFVCDKIVDNDLDDQIALCLVGKLHITTSFNKEAMKNTMCNAWKASKGLIIKDLDANLFIFQFFSMGDKAQVLNDGPWPFDGHLLLLREMTGMEQPLEMQFEYARFWVKVYELPMKT